MMNIFLILFFLPVLMYCLYYVYLIVSVFRESSSWGLASFLCPPVLIYYAYQHFDDFKLNTLLIIFLGIVLFFVSTPIGLFMFYVHVSSNGHALDRTHSAIMSEHFQPIHKALLQYKDDYGSFPTTEEGLSVLPVEYFPEHKPAWETRLETEYGPIIYTLDSPKQYTFLVPTKESINLWEDIDFTHRVSIENTPRDESRY